MHLDSSETLLFAEDRCRSHQILRYLWTPFALPPSFLFPFICSPWIFYLGVVLLGRVFDFCLLFSSISGSFVMGDTAFLLMSF